MKIFISIFMLIAMSTSIIQAQDLIVTSDNDSLDCQITEIRDGIIYFIFDDYNRTINSSISLDDIRFYEYDFYEYDSYEYDLFEHADIYPEDVTDRSFSRLRIAINGGWSYRTAKVHEDIPPDVVPYMKKLRPGYNIGTNLTYYFGEIHGTGIKVNYFNSKNEVNNTSMGDLKDNISIYFAGPTYGTRSLNRNNNNGWIFNVGLGYLGYYNKGSVNSRDVIFRGGSFGISWDASYDISISNNFAIGIQLSFISGQLTSIKMNEGYGIQKIKLEKDMYENLSQITLSVGFRFNANRINAN